MAAQLVACDTGEVGLLRLIERHGEEVFEAQVDGLLDYTEELTRSEIRTFPEGTYRFTDYLDDDGVHPGPVAISVAVTVADGSVTMDFEGSAQQVKASLNSTLSFTKSNAYARHADAAPLGHPEQRRVLPADHGHGAARQHRQLRPARRHRDPRPDRVPRRSTRCSGR